MPPLTEFQFQSPLAMSLSALAAILAAALAWRASMPVAAKVAGAACLVLMVFAAGGPVGQRQVPARLAVTVDLSPSTRGAAWRDPEWLRHLVERLREQGPTDVLAFASETARLELPAYTGADRPAEATRLDVPPDIDAALILTDGRLAIDSDGPASTLAVHQALLQPTDAAVTRLTVDGDSVLAAAAASPAAQPARRALVVGDRAQEWESSVLVRSPADAQRPTVAQLAGADDAWPENDVLRLPPVTMQAARRAWIGGGDIPPGFEPQAAPPQDAAELAGTSVLVLSNIPANAVPPSAQRAIRQYVMDMGGTLLLIGGDNSFAAGGYAGTLLDELSPLASRPPVPRARWVLLADASGSMAQQEQGRTRFELAAEALRHALPALPDTAQVDIGGFAASLQWWVRQVPAQAARERSFIPPNARRGGAGSVIVLTDAQVPLEDAAELEAVLRDAGVVLNIVSVGGGGGDSALRHLVDTTGGRFVAASDPARWGEAARELANAAMGEAIVAEPVRVQFVDPRVGEVEVAQWNRTWQKDQASSLVREAAEAEEAPRAAVWQVGLGRVVAIGFAAPAQTIDVLSDRFGSVADAGDVLVEWEGGPTLQVRVQTMSGAAAESVVVRRAGVDYEAARVAPGTWEARVDAPREPAIATVVVDGRVIERRATAGRYAAEFELPPTSLEALAEQFGAGGHEVIPLEALAQWQRPRRYQRMDLSTLAALAGCLAGAMAMVLWRRDAQSSPEARP